MSDGEKIDLVPYLVCLDEIDTISRTGEVAEVIGMLVECRGPAVAIGEFCEIQTSSGRPVRMQVVGFRNGRVLAMPLEDTGGIQLGDLVIARSDGVRLGVGAGLLGRVLDGFGEPIDSGPAIRPNAYQDLYKQPPNPLERKHITEQLVTGIRAIDGMLPCGKGQRLGLFGGSGVGKSTLLGMMSRHNSADVSVIALVGERNREVLAFLDNELGPGGLARSVVVVATSEQPAPLRIRACFVALAIAEYFRDQGKDVLLVMDSVTRLAMAQREIGLAAGEPPGQKGYPPSVFNMLPKIFERAGNFQNGSITGFFTVLVEGDDFNEPISDAVRGILDGHIVLSRQLAAAGHYPAIDVLNSISRLQSQLLTRDGLEAARKIRQALSLYRQSEDLIHLGAYVSGSNPQLDVSIRARGDLVRFLQQDADSQWRLSETQQGIEELASVLTPA